ncbi:MAG TPA: hypothetical protein PK926_00450 [Spirochaetota bacterium]|nr:hypothetical protein [Spirochaetota bacterium]HPI87821.1 hypothetical protein [Spirochaetota bacterium]HPR47548.1 hypothetical protein [Spirochaetota bacterium]
MRYEKMFKRFLELDNNAPLPVSVRIYMIFFPRFRKEIALLRSVLKKIQKEPPFNLPVDFSEDIMKRIEKLNLHYGHNISTMRWIFIGVIIWLSIMLITFSNSFSWLTDYFGARLLIPLNIVLGTGISIYAACYILSHLDELKKRVRYHF